VTGQGERPVINLDLVAHLDSDVSLFEVNLVRAERQVSVLFTDTDAEHYEVRLTPDSAWALHRIITTYDRRGVRQFGVLLGEAATMLNQEGE
jgi:hypothetical protein